MRRVTCLFGAMALLFLSVPLHGAPARLPAIFNHAVDLVKNPTAANWDAELNAINALRQKIEERAPRVPYKPLPTPGQGLTNTGERMEMLARTTLIVDGNLNIDNYLEECVVVVTGNLTVGGNIERSYVVVGGKATVDKHVDNSLLLVRPKNPLKVGSYTTNSILGAQTYENNKLLENTILFGDLKPGSFPEQRRSEILAARMLAEGFR